MKKFSNYTDYAVKVDGNKIDITDESILQVAVNVGILNVQKQLYSFAIKKPENEMAQNSTLVTPIADLHMGRRDDSYYISVEERDGSVVSKIHSVTITSDKKNRVYIEIMFDVSDNTGVEPEPCTVG